MEVPKQSGITRPGSILVPLDRLVYQVLIDLMAPIVDKEFDRTRVSSNILLSTDPGFQMFVPAHEGWEHMQATVTNLCRDPQYTYAIKADVSNFFERLYQHNLINLLHGSNCPASAVNLLEKLLLAWMEKNSHGIVQGIYPSDFFGNFYLVSFDSDAAVREIPSARYVDDIYMFFKDRESARKGLMELTRTLRHEGLSLNEKKTKVVETADLLTEETELDKLFRDAREEIEDQSTSFYSGYGFQTLWLPEEPPADEDELELKAVEALYSSINQSNPLIADKIEKFCLPHLAIAKSDIAVSRSFEGLVERPYLSKSYVSYLATIAELDANIALSLEKLIQTDNLPYDWQLMWVIGAIIRQPSAGEQTINSLLRILREVGRSPALRGIAAIAIGRLGHPAHRRNLKHHYSDEPSDYVRGAILFAVRYFPTPERRTALAAWAGHSRTNILIAEAVKRIAP
ncbi:MAG: reverse transcriptase domain-containing protein [bacterium]